MDALIQYQNTVLQHLNDRFYRSLYHKIDWDQRMFGILGLRGVGKTTILLQHLKYEITDTNALYVTADHPWFYNHSIFELATEFSKYGGKLLLIDEIHKQENWSRELKNVYDGFPDLRVIFTASSVLDLLKGKADLSRRVITYELSGLSFREYLELFHGYEFPVMELDEILCKQNSIIEEIKPLPFFREYLKTGYFPFAREEKKAPFRQKMNQILNTVLESDLQLIMNSSASNIHKIKRLLSVIAESAPFEPNISKIASKMKMGRDTVKEYINYLSRTRMLNLLNRKSKGVASLQKPDKIYLENTNLSYVLNQNPDTGTIRETFFLNQLRNAGYTVELGRNGDFLVDGSLTFEVGGKNKSQKQISDIENAYLALDNIEYSTYNRIPLWLFGFLY